MRRNQTLKDVDMKVDEDGEHSECEGREKHTEP